MNTITEELIKGFTDEQLYRLHAQIEAEEERRKRQYRSKLIEDFHKAWSALNDIVMIKYWEGDELAHLTMWDNFEFGD